MPKRVFGKCQQLRFAIEKFFPFSLPGCFLPTRIIFCNVFGISEKQLLFTFFRIMCCDTELRIFSLSMNADFSWLLFLLYKSSLKITASLENFVSETLKLFLIEILVDKIFLLDSGGGGQRVLLTVLLLKSADWFHLICSFVARSFKSDFCSIWIF